LPAARCALVAFLVSIVVFAGGGVAFCGVRGGVWFDGGAASLYRPSHGAMGLGFGFGSWWGPYESYAPPAYAYPPPVYAVPPPTVPAMPSVPGGSAVGACREFESTVIVDGQPRISRALACPQPDGTWRIVR
jgi:hypothetical protein